MQLGKLCTVDASRSFGRMCHPIKTHHHTVAQERRDVRYYSIQPRFIGGSVLYLPPLIPLARPDIESPRYDETTHCPSTRRSRIDHWQSLEGWETRGGNNTHTHNTQTHTRTHEAPKTSYGKRTMVVVRRPTTILRGRSDSVGPQYNFLLRKKETPIHPHPTPSHRFSVASEPL